MEKDWKILKEELFDFKNFTHIWRENSYIKFTAPNQSCYANLGTPERAKAELKKLTEKLTKRRKPMESIKGYFKKHEETCITLGIIILVDHFIFAGAFRQKIQDILDGLLAKTSKKLLEDEKAKEEQPKAG